MHVLWLNMTALIFAKVTVKPLLSFEHAEHLFGIEGRFSLGYKDHIVCKEQEQNSVPCQAWPVRNCSPVLYPAR